MVRFQRPKWLKGPSTTRLIAIALGLLCWAGYSWLIEGSAAEKFLISALSSWWMTVLFGVIMALRDRILKSRARGLDKLAAIVLIGIVVLPVLQGGGSSQFIWTVELVRAQALPLPVTAVLSMFLYVGSLLITPILFWYKPERPTAA